jgi:tripartite-type tricarboxylate transporter receptor subunit TctC
MRALRQALLLALLLPLAVLFSPLAALAQAQAPAFPTKPIRLIVPWPPGGVTDVLSRAVAQAMGDSMGQQLLVENHPGAGGTIGMAQAAKAAPDGYTIVTSDVPSHAISATLYAKLPYDVLKDFEPIGMVAGSPMVLATNPSFNVKTFPEFVKLVRANPGKFTYGSSGNGSITHLAMERMKRELGLDMLHIPYKGTIPAIQSVLSADGIVAFGTIPGVLPHAKAGKLIMLGNSFARRFDQIPDVPPIAKFDPGFDMGFYTAMWAPAKTPAPIIERLHAELVKAFKQDKVKTVFAASAAEPGAMDPEQLRAYMAKEVKAWGAIVKAVGLTID